MGRVVTNITREFSAHHEEWKLQVVDTWGPRPGRKSLSPYFFLIAVSTVIWQILRGRVGLLHVHMASKGSIVRKGVLVLLGRAFGVPVVLHLHGGKFDEHFQRVPSPLRRAIRVILRSATTVIVLGEHWHRFATRDAGLPPSRVVLLPNGVVLPAGPAENEKNKDIQILYLGRLEPEKGVDDLFSALADAALSPPGWFATIAGTGPLAHYRERARRLGIDHRIQLPGWQTEEQVQALLRGADILVLPSHFENSPLSVLEAMAHGAAVVATPVGSVSEVIEHEVSGLLVPPKEPRRLTEGIARLIADAPLRRRLGETAKQSIVRTGGMTEYGRRLREVYERCLHA